VQAALDRQSRLVMQQADQPVLLRENEFAGEEDAVRKLLVHLVRELGDFVNSVGAEGQIGFCRPALAVAEIDEIGEGHAGFHFHQFHVLAAAVCANPPCAH